VAGYSRELESEADQFGFEAMTQAGYDPQATTAFFELMVADRELLEKEVNLESGYSIRDPYFYANHTELIDRIALYQELRAERVRRCDRRRHSDEGSCLEARGRLGEDRYMSMIRVTALENARLNLSIGRRMAATRIVERRL